MQLKPFNPSYGFDYYEPRVRELWNKLISIMQGRPLLSVNDLLQLFPELDYRCYRVRRVFHDLIKEARPPGSKNDGDNDDTSLDHELFHELWEEAISEMVEVFDIFAAAKESGQKTNKAMKLFMGLAGQIAGEMLQPGGGATPRCKRFMILFDYLNHDDKVAPPIVYGLYQQSFQGG